MSADESVRPVSTVVAFVLNDARADSRVLRSAASLAAAGHAVTLVARTTDAYAAHGETERREDFTIVRVPVAAGWLRWLLLCRRPPALARAVANAVRRRPLWAVAAAVPALLVLPFALLAALPLAVAVVAGSLAVRRFPAIRTAWLAVSWRLQWRFGVLPWSRAAAAAAVEAAEPTPGEAVHGDRLVLHAHDLRALPAAMAARERLRRGAIIYDSHEIFAEAGEHARRPPAARRAIAALEARLARSAEALVTVNDELARRLGPALGFETVTVVHNAAPRWSPGEGAAAGSRLRSAVAIPAGAPILLYHGGIAPGRGIDTLLAAIHEPGLERAHLAFLGFGPSLAQVREAAADPAHGGRVHVLPAVPPDELLEWVAGASVVVAPIEPTTLNHRLSTPNKVFEAIAAGVPVVASDFPQLRAIVVDDPAGPLGAVADPQDPAAFARAVRSILELPSDGAAKLRERILAAAHERWNWETESAALVALVEGLAGAAGDGTTVPQRITFVLPSTGEYDARTRRFAASLAGRGHAVTIIARAGPGLADRETLGPGIRLLRVDAGEARAAPKPAGPLRILAEARRILGVARRAFRQARAADSVDDGADVYHAMGFLGLPIAARLARRHGVPYVYDARDLYVESNNIARLPRLARALFAYRERRWARRAAAVLTVNASCATYLERRFGIARPAVVMNGQPAWTPPEPRPDNIRKHLGLGPERRIALYHGGFMPDRGLLELVEAFARPGLENADLVLMGSGALDAELRARAADPATGGRVHVLPPVAPEVLLEWVASADVGVMVNQPRTLNERLSTPNKLFESLAAGLPVVSSDFPERRRIIVDDLGGPLGSVCDPTDPAAIAAAIRAILDLPEAERSALRARILDAAHARYAWDRQFDVALDLYRRVTGRRW